MTPQAAGRRWRQLVAAQEADRADHARRIQLAGLSQPLDPLLWPVIDRLWALGLPTLASCQGHPAQSTAAIAVTWIRFHTFAIDRNDQATRRRMWRFYCAFHQRQGFAMVATRHDLFASYPTRRQGLPFAERQARVLRRWTAIADAAGRECLRQEPPWEPWAGPVVDVPAAVLPDRSLVDFYHSLSGRQGLVVRARLDGQSWPGVARLVGLAEVECQRLWSLAWDVCLAYQRAKKEEEGHDTTTTPA